MPGAPSDNELAKAVLHLVESGKYPDSESVASAEVSSSLVPAVLQSLSKARDKARNEIKSISRKVAPDVDGWIEQARQLQIDIEESKATAQAIVKQAQEAESLRLKQDDAAKKVELLRGEVDFNSRLQGILEDVRDLGRELAAAQEALRQGKVVESSRQLQHVETALSTFDSIRTTAPIEILQQRTARLKSSLLEQVQNQWDNAVCFDRQTSTLTVRHSPSSTENTLDSIVDLCRRLGLLEDNLTRFCKDLEEVIIEPCLALQPGMLAPGLEFGSDSISLDKKWISSDVLVQMRNLASLSEMVARWMPFASETVSRLLVPSMTKRLLARRLEPSVPTSVDAIGLYRSLLTEAGSFQETLSSAGWTGADEISEWSGQASRVWLAKKREASLEEVRRVLQKGLDRRKTVEHVETQVVSQAEMLPAQNVSAEDWNDWQEDDTPDKAPEAAKGIETEAVDENAWGWDEDGQDEGPDKDMKHDDMSKNDEHEADENDAWGWDEPEAPESPKKETKKQVNGNGHAAAPQSREVTLRELYTTTAVPEDVLATIVQIADDAETLKEPEYADAPIADAVMGLYSIPTLALAGFRALAPTFYQELAAGNMLLYNDSVRLAEQLKTFAGKQSEADSASGQSEKMWPSTRMKLDVEISALESFGRRAYGKEMDSQRTVLRDLLDDTQGFVNCAEAPFAGECESAVSRTADRIRQIASEWSSILSKSALLQSLGSLLSTVIGKMIADIEDMNDIAEDESKQLRRFCNDMSKLSELFTQDSGSGKETDVTGIYTPNWFKFQYLSEIMESSLADIRYLWNEGELKLEFEPDELVDLIEALFAESELRRKAITEIRG